MPVSPESSAGTAAVLVWHREGGIAGFCDDLIVNADGSYSIDTCGSRPKNHRSGQLDAGQLKQLTGWVAQFQSFNTAKDKGAVYPDAMIQQIVFTGGGTALPGSDDLSLINKFASALLSVPASAAGSDGQPQAVSRAIDFLAGELNLPAAGVVVVSFDYLAWPDRCLGVTVMGQMCAQGVTPGYKIILQAQGVQYELHTDDTGKNIRELRQP
jgi:hypothetical protein